MEIMWHILLTVCLQSDCITQDVQWFDSKQDCYDMLPIYQLIPPDGRWDAVEYKCTLKDAIET
jgi:hypothetical protein